MCLLHRIGGAFRFKPEQIHDRLGEKARDRLKWAFDDVDPSKLIDHHAHIAGIGTGDTGAFVHQKMRSPFRHPIDRVKFNVYKSAAVIEDESRADEQFFARLLSLVDHMSVHGRHRLLAFDKNYHLDGTPNLQKTEFYVPNEYAFGLAEKHPDKFIANMSVNPYREDAIAELEKWAKRGGRVVKWLPNAMGIDPSNEKCDDFYRKMKALDLILLTHGGEEKAVEAAEDQKLGNPLLLRRPLEHGVKVIVAHCAGLGDNEDFESPEKKRVSNFALFLRLMDEKRYEGLLFGDISAMTQFNRIGHPLTTILEREDLADRLLNGSDYPLPAINVLIRTKPLVNAGYITKDERLELNEIYDFNPLLFDFALKRCLKNPGTEKHLPPKVFMVNAELGI